MRNSPASVVFDYMVFPVWFPGEQQKMQYACTFRVPSPSLKQASLSQALCMILYLGHAV
jgi:hypothetical protein